MGSGLMASFCTGGYSDAAAAPTGQFGGRTLIIKSGDPATSSLNSQNCYPDNGKTKWEILEKPDGSNVTETGETDASYSLTADLLGFYHIEMTYEIGSQEYAVPVIVIIGQPDHQNEGP